MYKIIITKKFSKEVLKNFTKSEFHKFNNFKEKLKINPFLGDMLRIYYVREFRLISGKRAYFIIYENEKFILFVGFSNKKNQRAVIEFIFNNLDNFKYFRN